MHDVAGKTLIVLLSGGLDSMVCAGLAREAGARIVALTIDYNQRHRVELEYWCGHALRRDRCNAPLPILGCPR